MKKDQSSQLQQTRIKELLNVPTVKEQQSINRAAQLQMTMMVKQLGSQIPATPQLTKDLVKRVDQAIIRTMLMALETRVDQTTVREKDLDPVNQADLVTSQKTEMHLVDQAGREIIRTMDLEHRRLKVLEADPEITTTVRLAQVNQAGMILLEMAVEEKNARMEDGQNGK
jgi:hypothetical protein